MRSHSPQIAVQIAVFSLTFLSFLPILGNDFLDWDDDRLLLNNPHWRGLGWENLRWMLTPFPSGGHYYPLTWLSFALDHEIWGLNPVGYHLTSLLLHAANAVLCFLLWRRLLALTAPDLAARSGDLSLASAFGALVFSIHPLRVESVAWAFERSDLLSGTFYLSTLLLYLGARSEASGRRRSLLLGGAWVAYLLGLLSKAIVITLPAALIILDIWPLRRLPGRGGWRSRACAAVLGEKVPFLLAAALSAVVNYRVQAATSARWSLEEMPVWGRLAQCLYGLAFYARKTVLPSGLLPLYMTPPKEAMLGWPFLASAAGVAAAVGLVWAFSRRLPFLAASAAHYGVTLLPVLGIVKSGPQLVGDRYSYLACLSLALLAGAGAGRLAATARRGLALTAAAGALFALGLLTWRQTLVWRDSDRFWSFMRDADPGHYVARGRLAEVRRGQGRTGEAVALYQEALALRPDFGAGHNNLGNILVNLGRFQEGEAHFREALRIKPGHASVHHNWAVGPGAPGPAAGGGGPLAGRAPDQPRPCRDPRFARGSPHPPGAPPGGGSGP